MEAASERVTSGSIALARTLISLAILALIALILCAR
jgi:hypothetical protein